MRSLRNNANTETGKRGNAIIIGSGEEGRSRFRASALPRSREFDVVIAGASFAGLAVAQRLRGKRVALLDRAPVGDGVTSACGAPVSIVRAMGGEASIQLVHARLVLHTRAGETGGPLPDRFCRWANPRSMLSRALTARGGYVMRP